MKNLLLLLIIFSITAQERIRPKIAIVEFGYEPDFKTVTYNFITIAKDPEIVGVIVELANGGGSAGTFSHLHGILKQVSTLKPIVVVIKDMAASGGYMVAAAGNYIIAAECAAIGSIGAYQAVEKRTNLKRTGEMNADVEIEFFKAGEYKALENPYSQSLTDDQKTYFTQEALKTYMQFVRIIAQDRNLPVDSYKDWAEGKMFIAYEAKELGLVDEIGTLLDAEQKILEMIKTKNPDSTYANEIEAIFYDDKPVEQKTSTHRYKGIIT